MAGEVGNADKTVRPLQKMNPEEGVKSFYTGVTFFFVRASIDLRRLSGKPLSLPD